ncbi:hypothetical protein MASR1M66_08190 [Aminivibrio sp.]
MGRLLQWPLVFFPSRGKGATRFPLMGGPGGKIKEFPPFSKPFKEEDKERGRLSEEDGNRRLKGENSPERRRREGHREGDIAAFGHGHGPEEKGSPLSEKDSVSPPPERAGVKIPSLRGPIRRTPLPTSFGEKGGRRVFGPPPFKDHPGDVILQGFIEGRRRRSCSSPEKRVWGISPPGGRRRI